MHRATAAAALAVLAIGAAATAGVITPVDPFTGDLQEGFEGFVFGEVPDSPHDVFGGAGEISFDGSSYNYLWVYSAIDEGFGWGLGGGVNAELFDGAKGMALDGTGGDTAVIELDDPVSAFGGYWASQTADPAIDFRFFDEGGDLIDTAQVLYDTGTENGALAWYGWTSSTPIGRIEIEGNYTAFDGLQINALPAPGSIAFVIVAWCGSRRRRRQDPRR